MIRVLFSTAGGTGHLHPLVPLAQAAQGRGHDVAFAGALEQARRRCSTSDRPSSERSSMDWPMSR